VEVADDPFPSATTSQEEPFVWLQKPFCVAVH